MQLNGFDFIVQSTHEISVGTGTSPQNCCTTQRSKMRKQKKTLASTTNMYMRTNRKTEAIGKKQKKNKF